MLTCPTFISFVGLGADVTSYRLIWPICTARLTGGGRTSTALLLLFLLVTRTGILQAAVSAPAAARATRLGRSGRPADAAPRRAAAASDCSSAGLDLS